MNYVGKFFSNFKGFYNDINSATLTGAIDIIVIRQEDGTFVSSPWHVRFGKMGVIRAREKVVDIEINGQPVNLFMKLGEAGEAFFVHEADLASLELDYLTSSPVPFELELVDHNAIFEPTDSDKTPIQSDFGSFAAITDVMYEAKPCDTVITIDGDTVTVSHSDSMKLAGEENVTTDNNHYFSIHDDTPKGISPFAKCSRKVTVGTQTDMSGYDVEVKQSRSRNPSGEVVVRRAESPYGGLAESPRQSFRPLSPYENIIGKRTDSVSPETILKVSPLVQRQKASNEMVENNEEKSKQQVSQGLESSVGCQTVSEHIETRRVGLESVKIDVKSSSSITTDSIIDIQTSITLNQPSKEVQTNSNSSYTTVEMNGVELEMNKELNGSDNRYNLEPVRDCAIEMPSFNSSNSVSVATDEELFEMDLSVDDISEKFDKKSHISRTSQDNSLSSNVTDPATISQSIDDSLKVLSPGGLAMIAGEISESHDLTAADRHDFIEEDWSSSQFAATFHPFSDTDFSPATSPIASRPASPKSDTELETALKYDVMSQTQLTGDELMVIDDIKWEWGEFPESSTSHLPSTPLLQTTSIEAAAKKEDKPSGGLFQFMRRTKKIRHQPESEGIYLEDLNLDEMDPEVAALYLCKPRSNSMAAVMTTRDDDTESGQGPSLPQSPTTSDIQQPAANEASNSITDVTLSLCGGLQDERGITSDRFIKHLVSYEKFCENPNLLSDPNLVVQIEGKYYNWQVAGPILMSTVAFNKRLTDVSVDRLMKQHMPKKERRRGFFWWGRSTDVTVTTMSTTNSTQHSIQTTATLSSNTKTSDVISKKAKSKHRKLVGREASTSGDESDPGSVGVKVDSKVIGGHTGTGKDKLRKSLKLTSEQIESLDLREGGNEVVFSVTTQYQGTSRCTCYIYLWNWDDRIVVSDIDGTITRSDVWGQVLPMIGKDWSQAGIANLYSLIDSNGYKFLYLSARAIGQSKITRDYLHSLRQGNLSLPDGPLLLSPSSLISAFYKEVIERKPEEFKIGCLKDIGALFPPAKNPFYAGFGNKINDTRAYRAVGIPISRIFTVNHKGELRMDMTLSFQSSYTKLSDIADHLFPPLLHCDCHNEMIVSGKFPGAIEYSDFTYWRDPLPDISCDLNQLQTRQEEDKKLNKKADAAKDKKSDSKSDKKADKK